VTEPRRDPGWLRRWWPLGLVIAALAFAVPETIAIVAPGEGGTLSEMTREWLGTESGGVTAGWVVLTVLLGGFAVWFPVHLRRGWPWERRREDSVEGG
jgi:hypothetical protein